MTPQNKTALVKFTSLGSMQCFDERKLFLHLATKLSEPPDYLPFFDYGSVTREIDEIKTICEFRNHDYFDNTELPREAFTNCNDIYLILFSVVCPESYEYIKKRILLEARTYAPNSPWILVGFNSHLRRDVRTLAELTEQRLRPISSAEVRKEYKGIYGYIELAELNLENVTQVINLGVRIHRYSKLQDRVREFYMMGGTGDIEGLSALLPESSSRTLLKEARYALLGAVQSNQLRAIRFLLMRGVSPHQKTPEGNTLLHVAAEQGYVRAIGCLLLYGAKLEAPNHLGQTALLSALLHGNASTVSYLLNRCLIATGPDSHNMLLMSAIEQGSLALMEALLLKGNIAAEYTNPAGESALSLAIAKDYPEIVLALLRQGGRLSGDKALRYAEQLLFTVVKQRDLEVLVLLFNQGVALSVQDDTGNTLLHWATCEAILRWLLDHAVNAAAQNCIGNTAFHLAVKNRQLPKLKLLITHGVGLEISNNEGNTPLHLAVVQNCIESVKLLLISKGSVSVANAVGDTPLHLAAKRGNLTIIECLLEHEANPAVKNVLGATALEVVVANGHMNCVACLLHYGAQFEWSREPQYGSQALFSVANCRNIEVFKQLLKTPSRLQAQNPEGAKILHAVARHGCVEVLAYLVSQGARLDEVDSEGNTVLHIASSCGQISIIEWLLAQGVALDTQNLQGATPLMLAAKHNQLKSLTCLLNEGASLEVVNKHFHTALCYAAAAGCATAVVMLLEHGARLDSDDPEADTALSLAASKSHRATVMSLLAQGAKFLTAKERSAGESFLLDTTKCGDIACLERLIDGGLGLVIRGGYERRTPLHLAAANGQIQMVNWLLAHGVEINVQDNSRNTAMHLALSNSYPIIAASLLRQGANLAQPNLKGYTPLLSAVARGNISSLEWLCKQGRLVDQTAEGDTALHIAVIYNQFAVVVWLLKQAVDFNVPNFAGERAVDLALGARQRPILFALIQAGARFVGEHAQACAGKMLVEAAGAGDHPLADCLFQGGASLGECDNKGNTALHLAAQEGHLGMVDWLLTCQIDVSIENNAGDTAVSLAVDRQHTAIALSLLRLDTVQKDQQIRTYIKQLLMSVVGMDDEVQLKCLIEAGINIQERLMDGNTALHFAAERGCTKVVGRLCQHGVPVGLKNDQGSSALHLAAQHGRSAVVSQLLSYGADPAEIDACGNNVFLCGAKHDHRSVIEILLTQSESGKLLNSQNTDGKSAIYYCAEQDNVALAAYLIGMGADVTLKISRTLLTSKRDAMAVAQARGCTELILLLSLSQQSNAFWRKYQSGTAAEQVVWCRQGDSTTNPLYLSARGGYAVAQRVYAQHCLSLGKTQAAVEYFCFAHFQGAATAESQFQLAMLYASGLGDVKVDVEQAAIHYQYAADLGHPEAVPRLKHLQTQLQERRLSTLLRHTQSLQLQQAVVFAERQQELRKRLVYLQYGLSPAGKIARLAAQTWSAIFHFERLVAYYPSVLRGTKLEGVRLGLPQSLLNFGKGVDLEQGALRWAEQVPFKVIKPTSSLVKRINACIATLVGVEKQLDLTQAGASSIKEVLEQLEACYKAYGKGLFSAAGAATQLQWLLCPNIMLRGCHDPIWLNTNVARTLTPSVIKKPVGQYGTAVVHSLNGVHFKYNPHAPGVEFMVSSLGHLISGQGATPTELLKVVSSDGLHYVYQASLTVVGQELETLLKHHPECIEKLVPTNFSAMVLLGMLTNPQDGKADNYMAEFTVEPETKAIKAVTLIGIDNDLAFADLTMVRHRSSDSKGPGERLHFANVKNVLYFLPQMHQPVDSTFRAAFLDQVPEQIILHWLKGIHLQNQQYQQLLLDGTFTQEEFSGSKVSKRGLQLPIKLVPGTIKRVYAKLLTLQEAMSKNSSISLWELFELVQPELAHHYASVKGRVDETYQQDEAQPQSDAASQVTRILEYMKVLYSEHIIDWQALKQFREQVAAGNRRIMTEMVLKTNEEFAFEDERTQLGPEMLLELIKAIDYQRFDHRETAKRFFDAIDALCVDVLKKSLWFSALEASVSELARWALKYKLVDVNVANKQGYTALHFAVGQGDLALVKLLIREGADMLAKNNLNNTALDLVSRRLANSGIGSVDAQASLREGQAAVLDYLLSIQFTEAQLSDEDDEAAVAVPPVVASASLFWPVAPDVQAFGEIVAHWEQRPLASNLFGESSEAAVVFPSNASQVLSSEARRYGLRCRDVPGDGNCFFHAVFLQLSPYWQTVYQSAMALRTAAVNHVVEHIEAYRDFLGCDSHTVDAFVNQLYERQSWAEQVIILATSRLLNCHLVIFRSDAGVPTVFRQRADAGRILLGYKVGKHYQAMLPEKSIVAQENVQELIDSAEEDEMNPLTAPPAVIQF